MKWSCASPRCTQYIQPYLSIQGGGSLAHIGSPTTLLQPLIERTLFLLPWPSSPLAVTTSRPSSPLTGRCHFQKYGLPPPTPALQSISTNPQAPQLPAGASGTGSSSRDPSAPSGGLEQRAPAASLPHPSPPPAVGPKTCILGTSLPQHVLSPTPGTGEDVLRLTTPPTQSLCLTKISVLRCMMMVK